MQREEPVAADGRDHGERRQVDVRFGTATLRLDSSRTSVFDRRTGQVGVSHVFITGDVGELHPLLREAADDGRIACDNGGCFPDVRVRPRRAALSFVFSDPQIVWAGRGHSELTDAGTAFETGRVCFGNPRRSRVMRNNRGALHVYGKRATGRSLGAEMIGPAAEHLGHLLAWSAQRGNTVQQMLDRPFYHPVIDEALRKALRDLHGALRIGPPPVEQCLERGHLARPKSIGSPG